MEHHNKLYTEMFIKPWISIEINFFLLTNFELPVPNSEEYKLWSSFDLYWLQRVQYCITIQRFSVTNGSCMLQDTSVAFEHQWLREM